MVLIVVVVCVVAALIASYYTLQWRNRHRPAEEQEAAFRKEFDRPQVGPAPDQVEIDLDDYRLPLDRMKAIGADCGFEFQRTAWMGKQGKRAYFVRRQEG
ncbi:hypothetical protein [Phaeacidiphilus oryzae]|uniref:hypothetical protein n=1 Tax=Phaeacidiphilus oryzae TaxID=348818 RepID=UPI000563F40F|nr:hypothetical protein [Phaeacidiphilus oryzae]